MDIRIKTIQDVTVVEILGEINGSTAPQAQARILAEAKPNGKMVLDMSQVSYMSSAGLRLLLVTYRSVAGKGGKVVLIGLSEDLAGTMANVGFLDFFPHRESLEAGLAALA